MPISAMRSGPGYALAGRQHRRHDHRRPACTGRLQTVVEILAMCCGPVT